MKKKMFSKLFMGCMVAAMLVGCGESSDSESNQATKESNESDSKQPTEETQSNEEVKEEVKDETKEETKEDANKDEQGEAKDFAKTMEAFKAFYDTFYEEHRFNGTYEETWDCFANIYMIENEPVMAVLDILKLEDYSYYNEQDEEYATNEVVTADLYLYEYSGKEVKERAKYTNVQTSDAEVYLIPMQDKLFMSYYDKEGQFVTAELDEYCTLLDEEYYAVYCDEAKSEIVDTEDKYIKYACNKWLKYDSFDEVVDNELSYGISSEGECIFFKTGLGSSANDGNYLLYWEHDREIDYALLNYQLVSDAIDFEEEEDFFFSTSFKKYLDYLAEQEITNNIDLRVCHSNYLIDSTKEDAKHLRVFVWRDGIYYVIDEGIAYVYAFDYGYTEDDLPKDLYGYKISDEYWVETKSKSDTYFPISLDYKLNLEDVWKEVEAVKVEYEQSVGAAIEAYEEYIEEKDYDGSDYYYSFIYIDDNDTPELYIENEWGNKTLLTYSEGQVCELSLSGGSFCYYERDGLYVDAYNRWAESGYTTVYQLDDGEKVPVITRHYNCDFSTVPETMTYYITVSWNDGWSEEDAVSKEEADAALEEVLKDCKSEKKNADGDTYGSLKKACKAVGLVY
ncbi:MAG: hypothetical protein IJY09_04730 [Lachnospiraceae bacterium]|nr:hypothetical protein [Lachnospiraceae bacterium]